MNKKLVTILTLCFVLCTAICGLTACSEQVPTHTHVYNQKVVSDTYLKSQATCEQKALYYYSCECGDVGSVAFENGDFNECNFVAGKCSVCEKPYPNSGNDQTQNSHTHVYNQKVVSDTYLKSQATCTQKAIYYYVCECGDVGSNTFESGDFGKHEYGAFKNNGNGTHTKTCINHSEHTITEKCYGGQATCREKATCLGCNAKYGELEEHTYSKEYSTSDTHHWYDSTCGCNLKKDYAEHVIGEDNCCETCSIPMSSTIGVIYDTSSDGTYAEVVGYEGTSKKVKIADTYNGLPVKTIYDNAFFHNTNITMVIIPDTVTSIGSFAFQSCDSLTSITIPDSVTSISDYAFQSCSSLTSITIPDSVTNIGDSTFEYCNSLTSVTIGDGVTSIGSSAFADCPYTVSGNLKYVGNEDNPYLVLVGTANANLSTYTINENTKYISNAFSSCSRLSTITIPDSVTSIGNNAFYTCDSLTSITIPDSVTSISEYAFLDCDSLTSVTIPDSVTSIGDYAFYCCSSLETIYCEAESKPSGWDSSWKSNCNAQVVWGYKV